MIDISSSTNDYTNIGCVPGEDKDLNDDGSVDDILDCEILSLLTLNDVAIESMIVRETRLVRFAGDVDEDEDYDAQIVPDDPVPPVPPDGNIDEIISESVVFISLRRLGLYLKT